MLGSLYHLQVTPVVIHGVAVDVIYFLIWRQFAAKHGLGHELMNVFIALWTGRNSEIVRTRIGRRSGSRAIPRSSSTRVGRPRDGFGAVAAHRVQVSVSLMAAPAR